MRPLLQVCLLLSTFALSQTPDPTPLDGRISGIVTGASGKPVSGATVSLVEQSVLSITDAYPLQIKTDLSLSEHLKAAIDDQVKSGQRKMSLGDIDCGVGQSSLRRHEQCLERRQETAGTGVRSPGMVAATD